MSLCKSVHKVVTLEKNPNNWTIAKHFLNNVNKIELINTDAFLYTPHDIFDLILLDGPKSHQEELVKKYLDYLSPNGLIIVDNIYLKKITTKTNLNKNQQKLVVKLTNFKRWLIDNKTIQVEFIDVDDGVAFINKIS
jgi:predicted O-methyltransferase YrrM